MHRGRPPSWRPVMHTSLHARSQPYAALIALSLLAMAACASGDAPALGTREQALAATHLSFSVQPSDTLRNLAIAPEIKVSALDTDDAVDTTFTGDITLAIANNPGSANLGGN